MDRDLKTFTKVVEHGSFSAAAEDLGLTPSAVSKLISRLEDRLGVTLLNRTTRRVSPTAEGETFNLRALDIIAAIEDAEMEVSASGQKPRGRLRVNCVTGFALHGLCRELSSFIAMYPEIKIELSVTDRVVDLLAENADVGIRSGVITDPNLVCRKITAFERSLYAAPEYLDRRGGPHSPKDLSQHDCIVHSTKQRNSWPFLINGAVVDVNIPSTLVVNNAEAAYRIALAGGGITRVADLFVGEAVKNGQLVPVLEAFQPPEPITLSAIYRHSRHRMPKVRAFLDFLVERLN